MASGFLIPIGALYQGFSDQGVVGRGYNIYTYVGGTVSSPIITYTDSTLTVQNSNPIVLGANGRFQNVNCWVPSGAVVKLVLTDDLNNPIVGGTIDNLTGINDIASVGNIFTVFAITPAEVTAGIVPTNLAYPPYDVRRYGVIGNGTTDDTAALNSIGSATWAQNITVTVPPGLICKTTDTVTFPGPYIALMMDPGALIDYSGTPDRACLILGDDIHGIAGKDYNVSVNFHNNANDYLSTSCVGVQIRGGWAGNRVRLNLATGFTVNWQLRGTNGGIAYNTFDLGVSANAVYHLEVHTFVANSFINENLFLNGDFQTYSNYVPGINGTAYGVSFRNEVGAYQGNNKNHFVKPCFQLTQAGIVGERVPIVFNNNGGLNQFQNCRFEGYNGELVRIAADVYSVQNNTIDIGYNITIAGTLIAYMTETDGGFSYGNRMTRYGAPLSSSYSMGDLVSKSNSVAANTITVAGLFFNPSATATEAAAGTAKIGKDFILVPPGSDAIGFYVDTSYYKNFELRWDCIAGNPGRSTFVAYNATNNQVSTARAVNFGGLSENANFGGHCYTESADGSGIIVFRVDSNIAQIKVMMAPGTLQGSVRGFTIKGFASLSEVANQNNGLSIYAGPLGAKQQTATTIPNLLGMSYANRGMVIYNTAAVGGVPFGWVNTANGYGPVAWTITTGYTLNRLVSNDTNKIYVCVVAGTSAGAGGPTGTGQGIVDGTCTWNYVAANTVTAVWVALANI